MTLTVRPITGSVRIIAVGDVSSIARGRPAEFRHKGLTVATRPTAIAALLELGREPNSIVLVPTDLRDVPLTDFIDVVRTVARVPVIAGIVPGGAAHLVSDLFDHGIASTVDLPTTPGRLAEAVHASRVPEHVEVPVLEVGRLILDQSQHRVTWHGKDIVMPPMRFNMLRYLIQAYPRAVPIRELVEFVGESSVNRVNGVRVAIGRLRAAFSDAAPDYRSPIDTIPHIGYRLHS